jgi:hypothetical protein
VGVPRLSEGSTLSIARELRRMVGFQIIAADDVRQAWTRSATRYIELRESGLFKQADPALGLDPPAFTDAIVFAKPMGAALRQQYPGRPARAYFDYCLLIDGEFYRCIAFD